MLHSGFLRVRDAIQMRDRRYTSPATCIVVWAPCAYLQNVDTQQVSTKTSCAVSSRSAASFLIFSVTLPTVSTCVADAMETAVAASADESDIDPSVLAAARLVQAFDSLSL